MEPQIVAAIIGPACTALLAVMGIALKNLQAQRRSHDSREREMRVAGQTITFIAGYLDASDKLALDVEQRDAVRTRATKDLEASYQAMMSAVQEEQESDGGPDWTGVVKSVLLIPVHRPAARLVRAFYYLALVYALATSALFIGGFFVDDGSSVSWPVAAFTVIILVGVNVLPALVLHLWAKRLESSTSFGASADRASAERPSWPVPTGHPLEPPPPRGDRTAASAVTARPPAR
jgi:hypothetical protein